MTITASPMTVPRIGPGRLGQVPVWELDAPRVQRLRLGDARYPGAPYYGSYGAYLIQAGLGRAVVRHGGGVAYQAPRVVPWGLRGYARLGGYPRGLGRVGPRRLGQDPSGVAPDCHSWIPGVPCSWSELGTDIRNIIPGASPVPGGGSGIDPTTGQPVYVNRQGQNQPTPDPCAGQSSVLCDLGAPTPDIPWWVWGIGVAALALYTGAGKGILSR